MGLAYKKVWWAAAREEPYLLAFVTALGAVGRLIQAEEEE